VQVTPDGRCAPRASSRPLYHPTIDRFAVWRHALARVLWYGDAGSHSGFARVTHSIVPKLIRDYGHDVHILALNYQGDWMPEIDGLKLYKASAMDPNDTFGLRRTAEIVRKVQPDVTVMLHDPAAIAMLLLRNRYDPEQELVNAAPIVAYMPIDGYNYPETQIDLLQQIVNPALLAKHGLTVFPRGQVVYHGVETDDFYPVAERPVRYLGGDIVDKRGCKAALGFDPNGFLILRVDKNSGRKDFAALVKAVAPLMEKDRTIQLHLHAATDPQAMGSNLPVLLTRYDLAPEQVFIPDLNQSMIHWDQEKLNVLYNAADLFVTTSRGEGWGLTIAEALACGVPVVAQNVSAIPEVVGPGGVLIEPERLLTVPAGHDLWLPNIQAFTDVVAELRDSPEKLRALGEAGRKHVAQFRWEPAAERFNDFIVGLSRWRSSTEASQ
jgi:glycosyltransferase involved in cell wall biosynthesis